MLFRSEAIEIGDVYSDVNDLVYAKFDDKTNTDSKKLQDVFVVEVEDKASGTNPPPVVTTGETYVDLKTKSAVVVYYKDGATQPTVTEAKSLVQAALEADGWTVTKIKPDGTDYIFDVQRGIEEDSYKFKENGSNIKAAYVGTIDGKEAWINKTGDTSKPKLKDANILNGVTMTGTFAKVTTGTGLTSTPAKDSFVAIGSGYNDAGVVVTGNGFNVTSGYVSVAGTDYTTKYVALNRKLTVAKTDFGTADTATGFIYTMGGATKYAAYGEEITVTGDVTAITKGYLKVTWNLPSGATIDTSKTNNTSYVQATTDQTLELTITVSGTVPANADTVTGTVKSGENNVTSTLSIASKVISGDAFNATSLTKDIVVTITELSKA